MAQWESIEADGLALADHLQQACDAAPLARPAIVHFGVVDGFYQGPVPLVEVIFDQQQLDLIPKSNYSDISQNFGSPGYFIARIRTRTDPALGVGANDAERELYRVHAVLIKWFAVVAHRALPDAAGTPRVAFAGPPFATKGSGVTGPYTLADGELGQALALRITVLGLGLEST